MSTSLRPATAQRVRLSAVDPELADALGADLADVTVPARRLAVGPWSGVPQDDGGLGVLLARGLIAHVTSLRGHRSVLMAWGGDVMTPVGHGPAWTAGQMHWEVLEPAVVAHLDAGFVAAICRRPESLAPVMSRIAALSARNVVAVAISQLPRVEDRLLGILLVLAEERGRVAGDGVHVPAFLTHERLGELIGAARPTVSLAFAKLRDRDLQVARDGEWVIALQAGESLVRPATPAGHA